MLEKLKPTKIICLTNTDKCDILKENYIEYINVSTFSKKPKKKGGSK